MKYAFVIDQRKCIGCHACTVACKSEHDVPIGVYRTWVKYIERGEFPNSRRYFLVNRCNHCDDAPCVAICPTKALYKRDDGIVDFDSSRCIGCKSCMQACPYDALYIDPYSHTAAKCNYCAHRTELGLEPACVVVCPERAIIAGDMHNPSTEIARIIAREPVRVRKPEQGTGPNVYYLGADEAAINPEAAYEELPHMSMWSTMLKPQYEDEHELDGSRTLRSPRTLNPLKVYQASTPVERQSAEAHVVYDTPKNRAPWGWKVSTYLATKSIGTGAMLVAALALALYGLGGSLSTLLGIGAPVLGGAFIAITLVLLVADLKRPDRALYLVTKPNPTSWLVWGGYILAIFGLIEAVWFAAAVFGFPELIRWLLIPAALFGIAAAGYTAFLFGQAEGRDFWQSPLFLPILIVQAVLAGAAALGLLAWMLGVQGALPTLFTAVLLGAIVVHTGLVLIEVFGAHSNKHVAIAARYMRQGALRETFWGPFFAIGSLIPVVMLGIALAIPSAQPGLLAIAAILALVGLFSYEHCFVTAGQIVPLS
ncbi:4Fe-4S dicluster domain-containing protein [Ktedonosporobacter rubrisoli]|uniref:4Fe-4S dicluster domain-containing protein n=1 Tax=Ktedonosporobacter rubrisoli TaxID=2509675 RepID=A0A4P6JTJ8_KTERU|nr:4Fe-4S dicluster domain-containing protein [Ktedonosporobacter rubrisoli]QBD78592.1 4Fe-4S dicluster domain-containing protein [Ktedonosporobacter rubrisoli]